MDILLGVELILVVIAGLLVMAVTTPSAPLRPRRRNSGTKQPGKLMRAVAAAALLAWLSAGAAASQQLPATPSPHWKVKYLGGTETSPTGERVTLAIEDGRIVCTAKKNEVFAFPAADIAEVAARNNRQHHPLATGLRTAGHVTGSMLRDGGGNGQAEAYIATVYLVYGFLPTVAISAAVHSREQYVVTLAWGEDSATSEASFQMRPRQYSAFISELRRVTGKPWPDLATEKQKLLREKGHAIAVRLPASAHVARAPLKPGTYQLVLIERENHEGDLYFIAGSKVNPRRIAAVAPVEILPGADQSAVPLVFRETAGAASLGEIHLPGKTLRVKGAETIPASR